jgi:hypothetical protein
LEGEERLKREMENLRARLSRLEGEVAGLKRVCRLGQHPVEVLLSQHGFPILSHGDHSLLLLPPDLSAAHAERFYRLMRRYSFRLFLRDLIQFPNSGEIGKLCRYCSPRTVKSYLEILSEIGIVSWKDGNYGLVRKGIPSFGPTLEWYVCEVMQREFLAPALYNLKLRHTQSGGDYDVVTIIAGRLAYIEVKSSPPRGVELPAISAFLDRFRELQPQVAVFLVDTELRMMDKMVPLFIESLLERKDWNGGAGVERLVHEIFHISHRIYLTNSRKGIYTNLRICFRDFLRWNKERRAPLIQ